MKLRLRSYDSKETLKVEAPSSCTLRQLKDILSQTLPNLPPPASIRLSLNRKDELQSDGQESLRSLGIAAGDLIFYSLEHNLYSQNSLPPKPDSTIESEYGDTHDALLEAKDSDSLTLRSHMEAENEITGISYNSDVMPKSFSVPGFLRKVFVEELGNDSGGDHKLIVTAVHAVFLESGFVGFDRDSNAVTNGFRFHDAWPSGVFTLSLFYTLPEIASGAGGDTSHIVVVKLQSLGKFLNVYGSVVGGGWEKYGTHSVRLNEDQLVPFFNVVWAGCCAPENVIGKDGSFSDTSSEKEVFKFWRTVKDNLSLPLLIDICDKTGLALPPCFMRLPTDLKLKVLELLPGVELAKVCCLCSELQYLASNDDLWKLKLAEEFGNGTDEVQGSWKKAFARAWERRNSRVLASRFRSAPYWPAPRGIRYGIPPVFPPLPHIIGGEHDLWPHFGNDIHTRLYDPGNRPSRNISPQCNFGGLGCPEFE